MICGFALATIHYSRITNHSGRITDLHRRIKADDAAGEGVAFCFGEAAGLKEGGHFFSAGEGFDGVGEVVVGGFFSGDEGGDAGHDSVEVDAVDAA